MSIVIKKYIVAGYAVNCSRMSGNLFDKLLNNYYYVSDKDKINRFIFLIDNYNSEYKPIIGLCLEFAPEFEEIDKPFLVTSELIKKHKSEVDDFIALYKLESYIESEYGIFFVTHFT